MWRGGDDRQPMLASMVFQAQRVDSAFRAVKKAGSVRYTQRLRPLPAVR
jgi:hypothetical protein